jgi:hypothetical protein
MLPGGELGHHLKNIPIQYQNRGSTDIRTTVHVAKMAQEGYPIFLDLKLFVKRHFHPQESQHRQRSFTTATQLPA